MHFESCKFNSPNRIRKFFLVIMILIFAPNAYANDKGYKYLDSQGNLNELINNGRTIEERDYSNSSINFQHTVHERDNSLQLLDSKGNLTDFIDKGSTIEKRDYSKGTIEILHKNDDE